MIFGEKPREKEARSWLGVAAWVTLIYVAIPLARSIQEVIRARGGKAAFLWLTFLCFAVAAGWVVRAMLRKQWTGRPVQILVLVAVGALFSGLTWSLRENGLLCIATGDHVLRFVPPLVVSHAQIEQALAILDRAL